MTPILVSWRPHRALVTILTNVDPIFRILLPPVRSINDVLRNMMSFRMEVLFEFPPGPDLDARKLCFLVIWVPIKRDVYTVRAVETTPIIARGEGQPVPVCPVMVVLHSLKIHVARYSSQFRSSNSGSPSEPKKLCSQIPQILQVVKGSLFELKKFDSQMWESLSPSHVLISAIKCRERSTG